MTSPGRLQRTFDQHATSELRDEYESRARSHAHDADADDVYDLESFLMDFAVPAVLDPEDPAYRPTPELVQSLFCWLRAAGRKTPRVPWFKVRR